MADVPGFRPVTHGLGFTNDWPSQPAVTVRIPGLGPVHIGDAANGLCGGMVFAELDLFYAGIPASGLARPPAGSPLFDYLVRRLVQSWDVPAGVLRYLTWMNLTDENRRVWGLSLEGVASRTAQQWAVVRAELDAGRPCPLGLVTVRSSNPRDLAQNHQVLAWGYDLDGETVSVKVDDPNTARDNADGVRISFSLADPGRGLDLHHNVAIAHPIRGFFAVGYARRDPAPALVG